MINLWHQNQMTDQLSLTNQRLSTINLKKIKFTSIPYRKDQNIAPQTHQEVIKNKALSAWEKW